MSIDTPAQRIEGVCDRIGRRDVVAIFLSWARQTDQSDEQMAFTFHTLALLPDAAFDEVTTAVISVMGIPTSVRQFTEGTVAAMVADPDLEAAVLAAVATGLHVAVTALGLYDPSTDEYIHADRTVPLAPANLPAEALALTPRPSRYLTP